MPIDATPVARNVFGEPIVPCSFSPLTGYFRDGCCKTDEHDDGTHVICAVMNQEFLEFSRMLGNDLITPRPEWRFPGLRAGDQWCLCAKRWKQAFDAGVAPAVVLESTNIKMLEIIDLATLKRFAAIDHDLA